MLCYVQIRHGLAEITKTFPENHVARMAACVAPPFSIDVAFTESSVHKPLYCIDYRLFLQFTFK